MEVSSYLALHRWPAAYPDDAATAIVPCDSGHPLTVKVVRIDDNPDEGILV